MRKDQLFSEDKGRILPFSPRRGQGWRPPPPPIEDLDTCAPRDDDDYPHRMKTNLATLVVVTLLVLCGWWLADSLAQMRKNQDCALSGRRNCTPIDIPREGSPGRADPLLTCRGSCQ